MTLRTLALSLAFTPLACAQSTLPAVFVANNGNIEGSVTSLTVAPTGNLTFVQKIITGSGNTAPANAGNNAYSISLSPNGRLLATSHATAATITEKVTIFRVNADATLTQLGQFNTPDSPLDLKWLSDTTIAVTETRSTGQNRLRVYTFNEPTLAWTLIDTEDCPGFTSALALHPAGTFLFAQHSPLSGGSSISSFAIATDGTLTAASNTPMGNYPLGPGVTPDGRFLYAAGGISGNVTTGFAIDANGTLNFLTGSPFPTPDSSPKQCVASPDGRFVFVGHGSASTVRSFALDEESGALTALSFVFDVGIQGALGDIATMRIPGRDLLLFTDRDFSTVNPNPRGILSYTINPDGSFTQNGTIVDTQGVSPNDIATWSPPITGCDDIDFNNNDVFPEDQDVIDFFNVLAGGDCPTCNDIDFNNNTVFPEDQDVIDFFTVLAGGTC
ncbi:MAG TPA: beta-propeller fold lactonase family protein [Phycisphaerales bacterium]|nr:beta-propeller fold lactonase family protein [Phycisphaerales bacterium]